MSEKQKEKKSKIIWIDGSNKLSGTTTNFAYNIGGYIPNNAQDITVELKSFYLPNNFITGAPGTRNYFNNYLLKLMVDFGCHTNQLIKSNGNYLLIGVIPFQAQIYWYNNLSTSILYNVRDSCETLKSSQLKYHIERPQDIINVLLYDYTNTEITLDGGGAVLNCIFSIQIEYYI